MEYYLNDNIPLNNQGNICMKFLEKIKTFKYTFIGFLFTYLSIVVFSHTAFAQTSTQSTEFVLLYKNEFTFLLCVITLALGSWLGVKLPTMSGEQELDKSIKFVTALLGGVLAFIYCLQKDKALTLMNPFWIAVVSVTLPLTILTLRDKVLAYAKSIKFTKNGE